MFSYNTPGSITIYVFIGIAIIGIFVALIYTKVIKKNIYAYCNKSIFTIKRLTDNLKKQVTFYDSKAIILSDLFLNLNGLKHGDIVFYYLATVLITNRFVLLLTYELNKQNRLVQDQSGKIVCLNKNNRSLLLPIEIQTVLDARKATTKLTQPLPLYIVVPWNNKNSNLIETTIPNVQICPSNKFDQLIKELFSKLPQIEDVDLLKVKREFTSKNYQKRMRLPFLNWRIKDTVWENKNK